MTRGSFFPTALGGGELSEELLSELGASFLGATAFPRGEDAALSGFLRSRKVLELGAGGARGVAGCVGLVSREENIDTARSSQASPFFGGSDCRPPRRFFVAFSSCAKLSEKRMHMR